MSTYTVHPHERHHRASEWTLQHPLVATVAALVAAVLAGALIGILFGLGLSEAPTATQHRAGGHALATVSAAQHAAIAAEQSSGAVVVASVDRLRSPARGGFAVGRTAGAASGFVLVQATREPAHGGFPGRSLGAGQHGRAAALLRAAAL